MTVGELEQILAQIRDKDLLVIMYVEQEYSREVKRVSVATRLDETLVILSDRKED